MGGWRPPHDGRPQAFTTRAYIAARRETHHGQPSLAGTAGVADRPYTEGNVLQATAIRTEPGMFDESMKYLAGPYRQIMEEQKKAGIIVGYDFYSALPRGKLRTILSDEIIRELVLK
jgi:hypothetical protein